MLGLGGAFDYVECSECGALQIARIPEDLDRFYPASYYARAEARPRTGRSLGRSLRALWSRARRCRGIAGTPLAGRRFGRFEWLARTATGLDAPILDVGCGSGLLLWRLHRIGFHDLTGIDERMVGERREPGGPRLLRETLETHRGVYHLVMAHHSFEHLRDPRSGFRALAALVGPGGWLLLRVPVASSWARRHYGSEWVQLDAPRHLFLPTPSTVETLAREVGLRVDLCVDDSGPFQIWGSELYRRDLDLESAGRSGRRVFGWRERLRFRMRARALRRRGLGDQACFYLRRS